MNLDLTTPGFSLTNARICLQAAADSYSSSTSSSFSNQFISKDFTDSLITSAETDTHLLLRRVGDVLIVAFRGSASLRNWLTDFDAHKQMVALPSGEDRFITPQSCSEMADVSPSPGGEGRGEGGRKLISPDQINHPSRPPSTLNRPHLHAGFYHAALSVHDQLRDALAKSGCETVFLTGHSLGGALAVVTAWLLYNGRASVPASPNISGAGSSQGSSGASPSPVLHSIYTFGQPRVGDAAFARSYQQSTLAPSTFRLTNRADLVPWVPGYLMGYRHFGNHIHLDALGLHENFPLAAELALNGLELWRESRRGECALLADHAIAQYQLALQ